MELWDVDAQKLLKTYKGVSSFAWSPDGKELATYTSPFDNPFSQTKTNDVPILDANTGAQIGPAIRLDQTVRSVSWSPNGRTIAINESSQIVFCAA